MNLKIWGIMAGASLLLTLLLFLLFPSSNSHKEKETGKVTTGSVSLNSPEVNLDSPPSEGKAKITGKVCVLDPNLLQTGITLVAEKIPTKERFTVYYPGPISETMVFSMEIEPGKYEVYSELNNRKRLGLYSQYVLCTSQGGKNCRDHQMIKLNVASGNTIRNVDICDYDWVN